MVAGDFNGDGRIDLAAAAPDGVSVLLGNGDGTFQPETTYSLGFAPTPSWPAISSSNGHLDLAVDGTPGSGQGGELAILLGNGDGTFRATASYPVGANPGNLLVGDFTGNGKLDLAFSIDGNPVPGQPIDGQSNTVSVMLGNGDGTFQPPVNYVVVSNAGIGTISSMVAEDFTGDGQLDSWYPPRLLRVGLFRRYSSGIRFRSSWEMATARSKLRSRS